MCEQVPTIHKATESWSDFTAHLSRNVSGRPETLQQAQKHVTDFVIHYNYVRLHSAIGYITPSDCLNGNGKLIAEQRDQKLEAARARRQLARQSSSQVA